MNFPSSVARADTFPVLCSSTPTPTPLAFIGPTPSSSCSVTPSPTAYPSLQVELLPLDYQASDGATLGWVVFPIPSPSATPTPTPSPLPGVILIHGSSWYRGDAFDVTGEGNDIQSAGYFVVSVRYELAPDGYIPNQPCHEDDGTTAGSRMAQQVNDIKAYVTAMRADPRCNGKIGVVGGSSGASHAVTVALDTTDSGVGVWPYWNAAARPDCAVMLSCIYDFSDWTPPTDHAATDPDFVLFGLENYAQTRVLNTLATLPLNPVTLVASAKAAGWRPLYMINSYGDHPTAYHQIVTMSCTLAANGLVLDTDYQRLTIPGTQHSFHYWNSWDHVHSDHSITVGRDVVAFLDAHPK